MMIEKLNTYMMSVYEFLRLSTSEFSNKVVEKVYKTEIGNILVYSDSRPANRMNPVTVWPWGEEPSNKVVNARRHEKIDWVVSIHTHKATNNVICAQMAVAIAEISIRRNLQGRYTGDLREKFGDYVNSLAKILIDESEMYSVSMLSDIAKYIVSDVRPIGNAATLHRLASAYVDNIRQDIYRVPSDYDLYHHIIKLDDNSDSNYAFTSELSSSLGKYWSRCLALSLRMMDVYAIQKENFKKSFLDYLKKVKSGVTYNESVLVEAFTAGNGISEWWIHDMEKEEEAKDQAKEVAKKEAKK